MVDLRLGVAAAHVAAGGDSDSMCVRGSACLLGSTRFLLGFVDQWTISYFMEMVG